MRPRRRFPRYPCDTRVKVTWWAADGKHHSWGLATDIGEDGMSATVSDQLNIGESVNLTFGFLESLEVRAIVRFQRGLFYGFEFLLLGDDAKQQISMFLDGVVKPKLTQEQIKAAERDIVEWRE